MNEFRIDAETTARLLLGYSIIFIYLIFLLFTALPLIPFGLFDFAKEKLTKKNCLMCRRVADFWVKCTNRVEFWLQPIIYKISVTEKLKMWRELSRENDDKDG